MQVPIFFFFFLKKIGIKKKGKEKNWKPNEYKVSFDSEFLKYFIRSHAWMKQAWGEDSISSRLIKRKKLKKTYFY